MPREMAALLISRGILLSDFLGDTGEYLGVLGSELGEDLSVEHKAVLLQLRNKRAVGLMAVVADSGVQADDPELAETRFLVAPVGARVPARAHERFVRVAFLLRTDAAVAFGAFKNVLAAFLRHDSSFDSCHTEIITN